MFFNHSSKNKYAYARAQEADKAAREAEARTEAILHGNPLLDMSGAAALLGASSAAGGMATVKRRWDDDIIFRNQARRKIGLSILGFHGFRRWAYAINALQTEPNCDVLLCCLSGRTQARDEPQIKKRFINDAIRSDFHKKVRCPRNGLFALVVQDCCILGKN